MKRTLREELKVVNSNSNCGMTTISSKAGEFVSPDVMLDDVRNLPYTVLSNGVTFDKVCYGGELKLGNGVVDGG